MTMPLRLYLAASVLVAGAASLAQEPAPAPAAAKGPPQSLADQQLAEQLPAREVRWLEVNGRQVLALHRKPSGGKPKGGVLILPGSHQPPTSPDTVDALRHTLSENNWHTLVITLPETTATRRPPPAPIAAAGDDNDGGDEAAQATELTAADATPAGLPHIAAGLRFLNQQGIFNIAIVGYGTGAVHGIEYITSLPPATNGALQQVRGIVIINPRNHLIGNQRDIADAIDELSVPALDLFLGVDYRDPREASARLYAGRELPQGQYTQTELPRTAPNWQQQEDRLTKRVRGWLDKHAAGHTVIGRPAN